MKIKNKGFTLIELLVVIAIVGLLSTMATVAARYAIDKAKIAKAQHAVDTIYSAIVMLGNDTNEWPGHQTVNEINSTSNEEFCDLDVIPINCSTGSLSDGLAGLVANDTTPFNNWNGPYMNNIAPDPWGHEYFFDTNYYVNENNVGCSCGTPANSVNCHNVVVVGSFGPDGLGVDKLTAPYDNLSSPLNSSLNACDDVIKIIAFQN